MSHQKVWIKLRSLLPICRNFFFQILAIDGQPLDSQISHQQAIGILQKAKGAVDLVVASSHQDDANFKAAALEASSAAAQAERDSASIGSDWCQVKHFVKDSLVFDYKNYFCPIKCCS